MKIWRNKYGEFLVWTGGLMALAIMNPNSYDSFSFCILHQLGIPWCPGCGLGHSISFLLHGDLNASFHAHPLSIPALLILLGRIYVLARLHLFPSKINNTWNLTTNQ